jgi:hypothetical protein
MVEAYLCEIYEFHLKVKQNTGLYFFMAGDVVDVDDINSFVVEFKVKEFASFLEFTLINNTWWTKESVMSNIHNDVYKLVFRC